MAGGHTQAIRVYNNIIIRKFKGLNSREITSLPEIKNVIRTRRFIQVIAKNKPHAHHKSPLQTTIEVLLIKILLLFFSTTEVSTYSKVINAFMR